MNQIQPEQRHTLMMNVIVTLLAPLFLDVSGGNVQRACLAATAMVNEYRARNQCDLLTVAQIIALGAASVHALTRSMEDDVSVHDMLALQRIGNALTRSHEALLRRLNKTCVDTAPPPPRREITPEVVAASSVKPVERAEAPPPAHPKAPPSATPESPGISDQRLREMWAISMVSEASDINDTLDDLPPEERRVAQIRVAALSGMANQLLTGVPALPATPGRPPDAIPPPL